MSVGLGDIKADGDCQAVEVSASSYDSEELEIEQDENFIILTRKQIQQLWVILDRFMDR